MAQQPGVPPAGGLEMTDRSYGWSTWQFFSGPTGAAHGKRSTWMRWYALGFTSLVLCIFITCLIVLMSAAREDREGTTEEEYEMIGKLIKTPKPVVVVVNRTTPSSSTPTSTSTSTPMLMPTEIPTTTPEPIVPQPKVCTVEGGGLQTILLPSDGVCSFVFYHSLQIKKNTNNFSTEEQAAMQPFFDRAQNSSRTRYGMSASLSDASNLLKRFKTQEGKQDYESYWNIRIYDWGFLFVNEFQAQAQAHQIVPALSVLKEMQEYLHSKREDPVFMFLGIFAREESICDQVAQHMKTIFTPAGVIVLGHLSYHDTERSDCAVMPPTNFHDPHFLSGATYGHTIGDAVHMARCLRGHGVRTKLSVSVTLRGRWTRPKSLTGPSVTARVEFYAECQSGIYRDVVALGRICDDPNGPYAINLRYDKNIKGVITFNKIQGYALTFDNQQALLEKICAAWQGVRNFQLAIAVYDVVHDSRDTKCDGQWLEGRWSRLRFLHRLSAFLEENYEDRDAIAACNQFV